MSATLTDILDECTSISRHGADYDRRMMHKVPAADVVDRVDFILRKCRDRVVLHCGCVGSGSPVDLHALVKGVAKQARGIDILPSDDPLVCGMDLDDAPDQMPGQSWGIELVLAPEILEHLTNPGRFLRSLKVYRCPVLITVPNAHSLVGLAHIKTGRENVNEDHVAYYSYCTLRRLIEKCGFNVTEFHWCNGKPLTAEGLIFVVE